MGRKHKSATPRACGVLLVDKPAGVTSHDVVAWARRRLDERAVGHCGTLDPAATGLLVLCVGPATRFVETLSAQNKRYEARFWLGESTDSGDADGQVLEQRPVDLDAGPAALKACAGLVGEHALAPPGFSAVKVDGVRAHERARRGEKVELEARPMRVFEVTKVRSCPAPDGRVCVEAELEVSKGTYLRSLAVELGARLGLPCRLDGLRRVAAGPVDLSAPGLVSGLEIERRIEGVAPSMDAKGRARRGRKPRVDLRGGPDDLHLRLRDPADLCGLEVVDVSSDRALAALARLELGQRLAWEGPEARALRGSEAASEAGNWLLRGPTRADGSHALIWVARGEGQGGRGPNLRVVRNVRMWPPGRVGGPGSVDAGS